jgi:hypothetical protein
VPVEQLTPEVAQRVRGIALGPGSPLRDSTTTKRSPARDLEHPEQVLLFDWARDPETLARFPELDVLYAIPNWFGRRTKRQGARAKAEGRLKDMPDVVLPVPRRSHEGAIYGGAYIEMKHLSGSVREGQQRRILQLRSRGNFADVATSYEAAKALLLYYLALPRAN